MLGKNPQRIYRKCSCDSGLLLAEGGERHFLEPTRGGFPARLGEIIRTCDHCFSHGGLCRSQKLSPTGLPGEQERLPPAPLLEGGKLSAPFLTSFSSQLPLRRLGDVRKTTFSPFSFPWPWPRPEPPHMNCGGLCSLPARHHPSTVHSSKTAPAPLGSACPGPSEPPATEKASVTTHERVNERTNSCAHEGPPQQSSWLQRSLPTTGKDGIHASDRAMTTSG